MTEFTDKYISTSDKAIESDSKKVELSDEAYAVCELLEKIFVQLFRGNR